MRQMWSHGALPGGSRRWIVALLAALVICSSPVAFVLSSYGHNGTPSISRRVDLAIGHSELRSPPLASVAAASVSTCRSSFSSLAASIAMVAAFVGAAQARRRSGTIARRVTREQIERLTVEDVPTTWTEGLTLGMARRRELAFRIQKELEDTFCLITYNCDIGNFKKQLAMREDFAQFDPFLRVSRLKKSIFRAAVRDTEWAAAGAFNAVRCHSWFIFVKDEEKLKPTIACIEKINKKHNMEAIFASKRAQAVKNKVLKPDAGYIFTFGAMIRDEWEWIPAEKVMKLKDFQTKTELIGRIAGSIKMITTKIAKGTKQLPQKIAVGTKKIVEKMEDEGKGTVADVVA